MVMVYVMSPMDCRYEMLDGIGLSVVAGFSVVMTIGRLVTVTCGMDAGGGGGTAAAGADELGAGLAAPATHLAIMHCCMSWLSTSWLFCLDGVRLRM
jgi:hypothetical protein